MKLSVTDEFLWDLYSFLEKSGDILSFITRPATMANYSPGIKNPIFEKYRKRKNEKEFNKLIYYLKKRNYIKVKKLIAKKAVIPTHKGISKALKASFSAEKRIKRKDGKWIMLMFDIPQAHKKARNLLKSVLRNSGYKLFQQSVWISPYDIYEKTEKLLQLYSLDNYVKIFLIEEI